MVPMGELKVDSLRIAKGAGGVGRAAYALIIGRCCDRARTTDVQLSGLRHVDHQRQPDPKIGRAPRPFEKSRPWVFLKSGPARAVERGVV